MFKIESDKFTFEENLIKFKSTLDYEDFITSLGNGDEELTILKQVNKNSLHCNLKSTDSKSNEDLYDEVLLSMLSADKLFQIDEWIIKIEMENEIVSVLNEKNASLVRYLINNIEHDSIYYFSTSDDVLELLENNAMEETCLKSTSGIFKICREGYAGAQQQTSAIGWRTCEVRYYRAGVYNSLWAGMYDHQPAYLPSEDYYCQMDLFYKFDDRCGKSYSNNGTNETVSFTYPRNPKDYKKRVYESSHQHEKYDLNTTFTVRVKNSSGELMGTKNHQIRYGY